MTGQVAVSVVLRTIFRWLPFVLFQTCCYIVSASILLFKSIGYGAGEVGVQNGLETAIRACTVTVSCLSKDHQTNNCRQ